MEGFLAASEAREHDTFPYLLVSSRLPIQEPTASGLLCGCAKPLMLSGPIDQLRIEMAQALAQKAYNNPACAELTWRLTVRRRCTPSA